MKCVSSRVTLKPELWSRVKCFEQDVCQRGPTQPLDHQLRIAKKRHQLCSAASIGVFIRSSVFATTSNVVKLDGCIRVDSARFYRHSLQLRAQINVDNLGGENYYVNAHDNNNSLSGGLTVRASVTANF